jgi:hypothetical protein
LVTAAAASTVIAVLSAYLLSRRPGIAIIREG